MTEEPDELIAHVRICGGIAPVTGRFYPEAERKGSGVYKMAVLISGFSFSKGFVPYTLRPLMLVVRAGDKA